MKRREVEERLALFEDLEGILGAMRSFALAELHRLGRREEAQRAVTDALAKTMEDLAPALPLEPVPRRDVWLLLGSVRGFCGTFNEDVVQRWRQEAGQDAPTVVVGERLGSLLPERAGLIRVPGVLGGLDAPAAIGRILDAVAEAQAGLGEESGLMVGLRDMDEARCQRLLPFAQPGQADRMLPFTQEAPPLLALKVAQQALFHRLLALLLRSVRAENHMRLLQMENALEHLERGRDELQRQRNRLRQEEIVEEIEVMISSRHRQFG
ncbi:MAG: F0F1 ATP synthase subunit gamma [Betaproteobacteria bacterium]|nr:F0F1 ATP synthase subunit gamma [Betaproteobacteria bacterium]